MTEKTIVSGQIVSQTQNIYKTRTTTAMTRLSVLTTKFNVRFAVDIRYACTYFRQTG